ncbi:MAG: crossover junction endodeoxyribonuclease RuvC [Candidatus Acidiferrales bacterium]
MARDSNSSATCSRLCVLGVDPAAAGATGYGVVEFLGSAPRLLRFGALKFPARATFGSRLREIHDLISQLVDEFAPDAIAVESVFTALNMGTALRLAEVRGVILLAAAQASIPAHSYSPREVKSSVAGYGAASKQQMQQMVSSALGLTEYPEPPDAADALAVALCHAHLSRAQERMAAAMNIRPATAASAAISNTAREAAATRTKNSLRNQTRAARIFGL